jgi:hypothetical protein
MQATERLLRSASMVLVCCVLPLAGCSCDDGGGGKDLDAGLDAFVEDPGDLDADFAEPLPKLDAGMELPGDPAPGLEGRCAVDTNKIYTAVETDTLLYGTPLAVNVFDSIYAVPYVGSSSGCLDAIYLSTFLGEKTAPPPSAASIIDECAVADLPVATWADERWLLAMVDNRVGPNHVWAQSYDAETMKTGTGQLISESNASSLAITTMRDGSVMVAWAETAPDGSSSLHVMPLSPSGKPRGDARIVDQWKAGAGTDPVKNPKFRYLGLVFTTLGEDGAGLAYWRYEAAVGASELVFAALDNVGKSTVPLWVLTKNAGPYASIDVSVNSSGGAIVYTQTEGESQHLWMQLIDDRGEPLRITLGPGTTPPSRIVGGGTRVVDVSVTKLRTTFAVAYRELVQNPDAGGEAQIRLMFLNRGANKLGTSDLSYTSDTGGRTAIKAGYDGSVVVSWTEINDEGKSVIRVVRLPCTG